MINEDRSLKGWTRLILKDKCKSNQGGIKMLKEKDVTKKLLESVATVFNKVVLDEGSMIKTGKRDGKKTTNDDLKTDIKKCADLLEPEDMPEFSEKDVEVMKVLGMELPGVAGGEEDATVEDPDTTETETGNDGGDKGNETTVPAEKKITRIQAVGAVLTDASNKNGLTREDMVKNSDVAYAAAGGKSNEKEAKWAVKVTLDVLGAVNLLKESDGKFSL